MINGRMLSAKCLCHNFTNCRFIWWPFYDKHHMLISIFVANYPCFALGRGGWSGMVRVDGAYTTLYHYHNHCHISLRLRACVIFILLCGVTLRGQANVVILVEKHCRHSVVIDIFYFCNRCCTHMLIYIDLVIYSNSANFPAFVSK